MKFSAVPLEQAEGQILAHNIPRVGHHPPLRKGSAIRGEDVAALREQGLQAVYTAALEPGDVGEDQAAAHIARAAAGQGVVLKGSAAGKASLAAAEGGVLWIDVARLECLNGIEGVAFATRRTHSRVEAGQLAATVKIVPYALREETVQRAVEMAHTPAPLLQVYPLAPRRVVFVFSGSPAARSRLERAFTAPLCQRVERAGSQVTGAAFIPLCGVEDELRLGETFVEHIGQGAELIVLISETSTMDYHDVLPRAVQWAGGDVLCLGVPVDPGNLLTIATLRGVPLLAVPGCARSSRENVVDLVLPALLSGAPLTRQDIARLGHGGLLTA
ncbi:MAG: hypothetical protein VB089_05365 [Anaerolineaceae bacterium]|nr:hypothetical protein [Anaerolineaceae bacterium]